jgi:hypothetical protein
MNQVLYAHMNNKKQTNKQKKVVWADDVVQLLEHM